MFRILFSLFFWALVGQWAYSEVKLVLPSVTPVIDLALNKLQIPTHDQWSAKSIDSWIASARSFGKASLAPAKTALRGQTQSNSPQIQGLVNVNNREWRAMPRRFSTNEAFSRF